MADYQLAENGVLADQLHEPLMRAGYLRVLHAGSRYKPQTERNHFMLDEYRRLDNTRVKAMVCLDISNKSNLVVVFRRLPAPLQLPAADNKMLGFIKGLFADRAQPELPPIEEESQDVVMTAADICKGAALPFAGSVQPDLVSLAQTLAGISSPSFYIDPEKSTDDVIALRGHVSSNVRAIAARENLLHGVAVTGDQKPNRLAKVGARQIMATTFVNMAVPLPNKNLILIHAHQGGLSAYTKSTEQPYSIESFINNYEAIITDHVMQSRAPLTCSSAPKLKA